MTGCFTLSKKDKAIVDTLVSSAAVVALTTTYYTQYSKWPKDLEELRIFSDQNDFPFDQFQITQLNFVEHDLLVTINRAASEVKKSEKDQARITEKLRIKPPVKNLSEYIVNYSQESDHSMPMTGEIRFTINKDANKVDQIKSKAGN